MNSTENIGTIAAQLHDGGWRKEDRDRLKSYYDLTDAETDEIIAMMEGMD